MKSWLDRAVNREVISIYSNSILGGFQEGVDKRAYTSKSTEIGFNPSQFRDGYTVKVSLTESKEGIYLALIVISDIYSYPLFEEKWMYKASELSKAKSSYKECVSISEEVKKYCEDNCLPPSSLQKYLKQAFLDTDQDKKIKSNNVSVNKANRMPAIEDDKYLNTVLFSRQNSSEGNTNSAKVQLKKGK